MTFLQELQKNGIKAELEIKINDADLFKLLGGLFVVLVLAVLVSKKM